MLTIFYNILSNLEIKILRIMLLSLYKLTITQIKKYNKN